MTDTFVVDEQGRFVVGKAQTTPEDESVGFLESIGNALSSWAMTPEDCFSRITSGVYSGTTMVNRLLERKGSRVGLIVTAGFEDYFMLERGMQTWLDYSYADRLHVATHIHNSPIIPKKLIRGVRERIDFLGDEVIPLYENEVEEAVLQLLRERVDFLVVSLLFSYKNSNHESRVEELAKRIMTRESTWVPILLASDYYPVHRDFPRLNTVAIDAYAAEKSRTQLRVLRERTKALGAKFDLRMMASHGGTVGIDSKELARTLVSGPIGGVIGGKYVANYLGIRNLVCTDIGGTSFDVSLITEGDYSIRPNPDIARFILAMPSVQVNSIGAGTGSFVRVDKTSKRIEIGPDSAGYRIGVCNPDSDVDTISITDCDVALGYLNPDYFLGGKIKLRRDRAINSIKEQLSEFIGVDIFDAAEGAVRLLEDNLRTHVNAVVIGKGYEPLNYSLISYGGGGPLHVVGYTDGLGFQDVLVPEWAPAFSAFGCACGDYEYRFDKSIELDMSPQSSEEQKLEISEVINEAWEELSGKAVTEFSKNNVPEEKIAFHTFVKMQYVGQLNDLEIRGTANKLREPRDLDALVKSFENLYGRIYASAARSPELGYSFTGAFVVASTKVPKPQLPNLHERGRTPQNGSLKGEREVYWKGKWIKSQIYEMESLAPGNIVKGPAVIEAPATTLVLPPDKETLLDGHRIFHIR